MLRYGFLPDDGSFLARGESANSQTVLEQAVVTISLTPRWVWHGISWSIPVNPYSDECEPFRDHWHSSQPPYDQRQQTSIGRKRLKTIDAEGNPLFPSPISPFIGSFLWTVKCEDYISIWCGVGLNLVLFYEINSRALVLTPRQMSTQHPLSQQMKKTQMGGGGLACLKMADSRAVSMVFGCLRPMRPGRVVTERAKHP